jgi:DNA-binding transcriptional LysR family regulator
MDLNLLPLFHAVAEARSFSRAAQRLRLPRSSVSRGIAALERDVGAQLLRRTTRQVALTAAGAALYDEVAPLLGRLDGALRRVPSEEAELRGELRLTAPNDVGVTLLGAVLPRFAARHPALRVDVRVTNRAVDLVAEGFDAALRASARPLADSSLIARRLGGTEMQLFAAPTWLARRGTPRTLEEAATHEWVTFPRWRPPPQLRGLRARLVSDDFFFVREALRAGGGIGVLPSFLGAPDVTAGTLVRVVPRWSDTRGMLSFVYPETAHVPPKVAALRDFLLGWLAANPLS